MMSKKAIEIESLEEEEDHDYSDDLSNAPSSSPKHKNSCYFTCFLLK